LIEGSARRFVNAAIGLNVVEVRGTVVPNTALLGEAFFGSISAFAYPRLSPGAPEPGKEFQSI
jgi:hypothetical protein